MWEKTEISTRNCYNAIVESEGIVSCRVGKEREDWSKVGNKTLFLYDGDNKKLTDKRVDSRGILFASCKNCPDFDNNWD